LIALGDRDGACRVWQHGLTAARNKAAIEKRATSCARRARDAARKTPAASSSAPSGESP
jgi:hypothetical protein